MITIREKQARMCANQGAKAGKNRDWRRVIGDEGQAMEWKQTCESADIGR